MYTTWHAAVCIHMLLFQLDQYTISESDKKTCCSSCLHPILNSKRNLLTVKNGHIMATGWWHLMCTYNIFMLLGIFDLGEKSCCFPTYKWGSITELFHLTILHGFDSLYYLEVPSLSAVVCYCFIREQQLRMNLCHAILFIVHF